MFGVVSEYFHLQWESEDGVKVLKLLGCAIVFAFYSTGRAVIIPDFQVNPQDTAFIWQLTTDIAFQPNGNFVVVWEDRGKNNDNRQVYFQRFDSLANPLSTAVLVSDTTTGFYNQECKIATDSAGNFAICYSSIKDTTVNPIGSYIFWDIWVRLYNAIGQPVAPSIKVDVDRPDINLAHIESNPHIARHINDEFVVVWQEEASSETPLRRIYCQFFDSNGQRVGNNIWVSNPDSSEIPIKSHSVFPRVSISDNGYVMVCWEGMPAGQNQEHPLASIFSVDGLRLRNIFSLISASDPDWIFGSKPDVDATPNNNFVVSCNALDAHLSYPNNAIIAMRFDSLGIPLNRPVVVIDTVDIGDVFRMPRINATQDGYVVVWSDSRINTDSRNLMAQRLDYNDQLIGPNYRVNGLPNSLQQNWMWYDLDISSAGKVGFAWSDFRNFNPYHYDIYAKIFDLSDIGTYVSGDLNQDGKANITDVIFLVNYVFKGGMQPSPLFLADVNADCKVNLTDIIYLVNYVFKGGNSPKQGCAY